MNDKQTIIKISELTMSFEHKILFNNLNFEIQKGDFLSIIGPNGSGKSTLLKLIMKKLVPKHGAVIYQGKNFGIKQIGFVPQTRNINGDYPLNISSFIGLRLYDNLIPWLTKNDKNRIKKSLKTVRLDDKQDQLLSQSSGGEQQRAYIAQAMVGDPEIIILDEPTNGLDERSKNEIMEILKILQKNDQVTVVIVSHDPDAVRKNSTKILQLRDDGTFVFGDERVLENNHVEF